MSNQVQLVMQSYGRRSEYLRAVFSIWSFYAHVSTSFRNTSTFLYTDDPSFFKEYFRDVPVTCVPLTADAIKAMRGKDDFLHRMKIAVLEDAFQRTEGDIFYVDSDTFFVKDPSYLMLAVTGQLSFMHTREYTFRSLSKMPLPSGAPFIAVLKELEKNSFTMADGSIRRFDTDLFSWNAGVMILHRDTRSLLPDVFAVTDQLYAATRNHASEQYAFSLILQLNTNLEACETVIYHYWYRIKKQIADELLAGMIDKEWATLPVDEKKNSVLGWTRKLPGTFDKHLLMAKDNAVQAFNAGDMRKGYLWSMKVLIRRPFSISFIRDVAYHTRRFLFGS